MANRRQDYISIYGAFMVTIILWGSAFPFIKFALQDFQAEHLSTLRLVIASVILMLIGYIKKVSFPDMKDIPLLVLLGICGFAVYHTALSIGEYYVSAGIASLLVSTTPIFSALLATTFLQATFSKFAWLGSIIAFLGIALISLGNGSQLKAYFIGIVLILLASFGESIYFTFQQSLLEKYGFMSLTVYTMFAGALAMLIWLPGSLQDLQSAHVDTILAVLYLAIGPSVIPYLALAYTIQKMGVSDATISLYLTPVISLVFAYFMLEEIPTIFAVIGGCVTLIGVGITAFREK
ncbi:DMT family transporter [Staphylococcus americanisciuri]|uniref:DMT family transporter n=1 Tax=Staphylococcus americanisciuri TaxID=2973940 RepID=A0ABT2F034_9STAP|nr:DMT family transporter [Staphylococcus americanisciuri]MCS4485813.1 DMT family transporter [Staphylococcus americanisciuri]